MGRAQALRVAGGTKRCPVGLLWGRAQPGANAEAAEVAAKGETAERLAERPESSDAQPWPLGLDVPDGAQARDEEEPNARPWVVAEILSDGTVQVLDRAGEAESAGPWESGIIAGERWTIWWERRRWSDG